MTDVAVLHVKGPRSLVRIVHPDGRVAYGVAERSGDGETFVFQGTKAEAKKFYGTWRSDAKNR